MRRRAESLNAGEQRVIPLVEEKIKLEKRARITGTTKVRKVIREVETIVDEPLLQEEVTVKRVPVNEYIQRPRTVRLEDGVTIIPVMEEVLVVEKKLLLKEEVHITRRSSSVRRPQRVVLRKEEAVVERSGPEHEHERPAGEAVEKGGKQ